MHTSIQILSMAVLGGLGSIAGSIIGAFLLTVLPEILRKLADYQDIFYGGLLVALMVFRPQGIMGQGQDNRHLREENLMLTLRNIHAHYGRIHAVKGVSIHLMEGEIVALIGGNGAGKSSILKTVSGLLKTSSGEVIFGEETITGKTPDKILKMGIGHVPEGRRLFKGLTVKDNLLLGAYSRKDRKKIASDIESMERLFSHTCTKALPGIRHAFRRRAADAGHSQGAYGKTQGFAT